MQLMGDHHFKGVPQQLGERSFLPWRYETDFIGFSYARRNFLQMQRCKLLYLGKFLHGHIINRWSLRWSKKNRGLLDNHQTKVNRFLELNGEKFWYYDCFWESIKNVAPIEDDTFEMFTTFSKETIWIALNPDRFEEKELRFGKHYWEKWNCYLSIILRAKGRTIQATPVNLQGFGEQEILPTTHSV